MSAALGLALNRSTKLACAVTATAAYFLLAHWLTISYVNVSYVRPDSIAPNVAGEKVELVRPFAKFLDSDFAVIGQNHLFKELADSADNNERSTIELYENGRRLGPPHSQHADIAMIGRGRFSHWKRGNSIFVFSSSDNSNPQTNGRAYWAVKPDAPEPASEP